MIFFYSYFISINKYRRFRKISKNDKNEIKVEIIKTKLRQNLEANINSVKSIIVFHNLNNATSAVLELNINIFYYKQEAILLMVLK